MSQTNIREGYRITTLEVIKLIEDLISYVKKKDLLKKIQLEKSQLQLLKSLPKCTQLRNAQIPKVFHKAAAETIWTIMLAKVRQYSAKVKTENLSNTLTLTLSETAQQQSSSVVSNRSTALITNKFSVASFTEPAILNDANVALVDAVHHSYQAGTSQVIDALTMMLIKDDDDLLGTVNSHIKLRRLRARRKTEAADSRYAKVSRRRTKKDKDSEDSNTSSDVLRPRRRDRAAARAQSAKRKQLGKEAQLKKTRDEEELAKAKKEKEEKELTDAYILYFKELSSNNGGIFANAMSMGKTRAIVLATEVQNARAEGNATEYNAVNDDDKLCPTKGERTFYCADLLALQFCFFSDSPLENIGRLTKEEAIEIQINTTNAISKALAAANKLGKLISSIKGDFLPYFQSCLYLDFLSTVQNAEQQCRDILEKEGLNKLEASRRVIFNRFKMQAIASYSALATLKAAQFKTYSSCKVKRFTLNSVKDLFTNLSKDYFLVREARAITKSSSKFQNLSNLCSKIIVALMAFAEAITLIEATHVVIIEPQDRQNTQDQFIFRVIVYFNPDSELELKVLGKQDVKTTSRDKLQGRGSTVTDQRID
ncbi:hypothetical protein HBH49_155950 [Parastagonospora nodorum]|nr:hypothetical protein HBH49_155950 [Parastagonospora nodorum]